MMTILDEFRRDEQRVLDRLVDGELGLHERRELLAGLDDEPGAWRRCALAFLESQSWGWQMARVANEPILAQLTAPRPASPVRSGKFWSGFLAVAASLIVAFVAGTRFSSPAPSEPTVAVSDPGAPIEPQPQVVARPKSQSAGNEMAADVGEASNPPWRTLRLTPVGDSDSAAPIELRVVEDGTQDPWFADEGPLSSSLAQRLEQDGWEVNRRQRLVPLALSDGRELVVPVEEVDLRRPPVVQF
jgi:hypothetical protein